MGVTSPTDEKAEEEETYGKSEQANYILQVTVVEAADLANKDKIGKSDPYVVVKFQDQEFRSPTVKNSLSPKWNFLSSFKVSADETDSIYFDVYDDDVLKADEPQGSFSISIPDAFDEDTNTKWFDLKYCKSGKIAVSFVFTEDVEEDKEAGESTEKEDISPIIEKKDLSSTNKQNATPTSDEKNSTPISEKEFSTTSGKEDHKATSEKKNVEDDKVAPTSDKKEVSPIDDDNKASPTLDKDEVASISNKEGTSTSDKVDDALTSDKKDVEDEKVAPTSDKKEVTPIADDKDAAPTSDKKEV